MGCGASSRIHPAKEGVTPTKQLAETPKIIPSYPPTPLPTPVKTTRGRKLSDENKLFGIPLSTLAKRDKSSVPLFIINAIDKLSRCVDIEGLLRIAGSVANVQKLKLDLDKGLIGDMANTFDLTDSHDVASLLKIFLRELPVPVVPPEMNDKLQTILETRGEKSVVKDLKTLIDSMPVEHKETFVYILCFLSLLGNNSKKNLMTFRNIALIIGPCLMRQKEVESSRGVTVSDLGAIGKQTEIIFMILQNWEELRRFYKEPELYPLEEPLEYEPRY